MRGNLSSIIKTSLVILVGVVFMYFFFRFLPVLLVVAFAIYAFFKIKNKIKKRNENKEYNTKFEEKIEEVNFDKKYDLTNKNVIDVEYHEVEK